MGPYVCLTELMLPGTQFKMLFLFTCEDTGTQGGGEVGQSGWLPKISW